MLWSAYEAKVPLEEHMFIEGDLPVATLTHKASMIQTCILAPWLCLRAKEDAEKAGRVYERILKEIGDPVRIRTRTHSDDSIMSRMPSVEWKVLSYITSPTHITQAVVEAVEIDNWRTMSHLHPLWDLEDALGRLNPAGEIIIM